MKQCKEKDLKTILFSCVTRMVTELSVSLDVFFKSFFLDLIWVFILDVRNRFVISFEGSYHASHKIWHLKCYFYVDFNIGTHLPLTCPWRHAQTKKEVKIKNTKERKHESGRRKKTSKLFQMNLDFILKSNIDNERNLLKFKSLKITLF